MPRNENVQPTLEASQKLMNLDEVVQHPADSRVSQFAKFLSGRLNPEIVPMGFIMAAQLALYDVEHGVDGFSGESLNTGLEDQPGYVYDLILVNIPDLADASFPKPFADEVRETFLAINSGSGLSEDEVVKRPITTMKDAEELILNSAKRRIQNLDWAHFRVDIHEERTEAIIEASLPLILRQSGMNFPLNILQKGAYKEALALKDIPPERQESEADRFVLAMTTDSISVEEATLIRDWLYIKAPEAVAGMNKLPVETVIQYFMESDPNFKRAGVRALELIRARR